MKAKKSGESECKIDNIAVSLRCLRSQLVLVDIRTIRYAATKMQPMLIIVKRKLINAPTAGLL